MKRSALVVLLEGLSAHPNAVRPNLGCRDKHSRLLPPSSLVVPTLLWVGHDPPCCCPSERGHAGSVRVISLLVGTFTESAQSVTCEHQRVMSSETWAVEVDSVGRILAHPNVRSPIPAVLVMVVVVVAVVCWCCLFARSPSRSSEPRRHVTKTMMY